jgi:hypothetical protein
MVVLAGYKASICPVADVSWSRWFGDVWNGSKVGKLRLNLHTLCYSCQSRTASIAFCRKRWGDIIPLVKLIALYNFNFNVVSLVYFL